MTKEERDKAIRILQWLHNNNFLFRSTEEDVKFATEYAIKALEQESILDKIDEIITDALDKSTDQKESQTLRWVLDKISEVQDE